MKNWPWAGHKGIFLEKSLLPFLDPHGLLLLGTGKHAPH